LDDNKVILIVGALALGAVLLWAFTRKPTVAKEYG